MNLTSASKEYNLPNVGTVYWARYKGNDKILLKLSDTLTALKKSTVPVYRSLFEQAEQFFNKVKSGMSGNMPTVLPVTVPHAGKIPVPGLGTLYHVRYGTTDCVIPERIMVGEWQKHPGK